MTSSYVFDLVAQVLVESTNGQDQYYLPGLAQYNSTAGWEYITGDRLGSTRLLVKPNGELALSQSFDPFGNVLEQVGPGVSGFGYTGEQTDPTGLVFLRARYYDPALGRFLTPDSLIPDPLRSQVWNRYTYVVNNPVKFVDPSGHQGCTATLHDDRVLPSICLPEGGPDLRPVAQVIVHVATAVVGAIAPAPELPQQPGTSLLDEQIIPCFENGPGLEVGTDIWPPVIDTPLPLGSPFPTFYGTPLEPEAFGDDVLQSTPMSSDQIRKAIRSLERQIAEHREKLEAYRRNPDAFDNQGLLRNAQTPQIRQKIIEGRIAKLEGEIRKFEREIQKLLQQLQ